MNLIEFFTDAYKDTSWFVISLEMLAFVFGIASVYYAKKENILVYPTGLVATCITVFLLYRAGYFGDMVVNFYYSVMSIYGWYIWSRPTVDNGILPISRTTKREKLIGLMLFIVTIVVIFVVYRIFAQAIEVENYIDVFTSGIFFTAMYFMALKKIENWTLWIVADIISIPLYAYRGLGILSLQFLIFTIMAVQAYIEWKKTLDMPKMATK
ncbi:nicotinamide riboside transporter PnuC [Flavobacterium ardleyense]|uniref:nicotinamide riboside transporter PnuC n=1 Tax=Flavobacterium ardleyense TaxID=2038737 RepID=UPI00298C3F92|nr:nicotinamide riboside transporter PnuC [Flavobacterium ardleyense]